MVTSPFPEVIFLEALVGLPSKKELLIESPRAHCIKKFADELLAVKKTLRYEQNFTYLQLNCVQLMESSAPSTMTKLREQLWIQYD